MPDRQVPWRKVANRLSGELEVKTGVGGSHMELRALVDDIPVEVSALSAPYAVSGGRTEVRARAPEPLGVKLYLMRNFGTVPLYRRFLLRDVIIGAPLFDTNWIINAAREAHAQAFLDPEIRRLLEYVPVTLSPASYHRETRNVFYDFALRGREVLAFSDNFESDPDRMIAAIQAAVALAKQPENLLNRWRSLAAELDGKFEHSSRFKMEGSTRVRFALGGRPLVASPLIVRLRWRRDRLRTRISCESSGGESQRALRWATGEDTAALGLKADVVQAALGDSKAVHLRRTSKIVEIDLDGNVTDKAPIIAAGSLAALLSRGREGISGPYR